MYIDSSTQQEILQRATLEEALTKYCTTARGRNKYVCPMCGKTMEYSPAKKVVKCFHCDWGTTSAAQLLMDTTKCTFPEALERLAADFGIVIPEKKYPAKKPKAAAKAEAWYKQQLAASALTPADVRAWCFDGDTRATFSPFRQGTVGADGQPSDQGDDMLILYLDLDGHQLQYSPTLKNGRAGEPRDYFRVRWQIPESHTLRDGTVCKYKSPAGSGVQLYIPERLREAYRTREKLEALYFTEGEKKAEAVSKYVGPAFGLAGINCLVGRDKQLPEAIVRVMEACQVQRVYFIMDSDWADLSRNLGTESDVRQRPQAFFSAARNFAAWFKTLRNRQIFADCYLVLGKGDEKGVDDLLAGSLREHPDRYLEAIAQGTNAAIEGGHTDWFDLYNITTMPEARLAELWHLGNIDDFVDHHRDVLSKLDEFRAWSNHWRIDDDGNLVLAQPLSEDEKFWEEVKQTDRHGNERTDYRFNYARAYTFLERRGHWRMANDIGTFDYVTVRDHRLRIVDPVVFKDFVLDFARCINNEAVLNMLFRASSNYLGPASLSNMQYYNPQFVKPDRDSQVLFFKTKYWRVSADGIEENDIANIPFDYWQRDLKDYDAHRLPQRMISVSHTDEGFHIDFGADARDCDFLQFLLLTSWFDWQKQLDADRRPKDGCSGLPPEEAYLHLLSKMTAIGYLLHQYHNPAVAKAVIAMDETISSVGESQGRSGKSLIGLALEQMQPTVTIPAKNLDFANDRFLWEEVDSSTRLVILDDIAINFDFEQMFPLITTSMTVNRKGVGRFTLEGHRKPKFYITTNHTVNGNNGSTRDRQFKLAFSNYFDDEYKPERQFGCQFFSEYWDERQWNLFYNLMAECLLLYFEVQRGQWGVSQSGLIAAPCENIERRQMRQQMTETFYRWANDWFRIDEDDPHNTEGGARFDEPEVTRAELYVSYRESCTRREQNFITPQKFWQRLELWCRYHGFCLNPHTPRDAHGRPGHDKRGGTEYVTIGERPLEG